jgi:hypothetical protein
MVAEFPLRIGTRALAVVTARLEAARQLYNAVLGDALRRLARCHRDSGWTAALALPKATPEQRKARGQAFRDIRTQHGFTEYALHAHPSLAASCWLRGHLDVHAGQGIATRAFRAADRWAFGAGGRPRFKRCGELESVEGKSNASGIRLRILDGTLGVAWNGAFADLWLPLAWNGTDDVWRHALALLGALGPLPLKATPDAVKYVRLVMRTLKGRRHLFAQVVLEGDPLRKAKHAVADRDGALDLGLAEVAVVLPPTSTQPARAVKLPFCAGLDAKAAAIRRYQRLVDRQRRAANPDNYRPDGTMKSRNQRQPWVRSRSQGKVELRLAEAARTMAAQRTSLQGATAHAVLALGNRWLGEDVNVRDWAQEHGRSVGHHAPGLCQARIATLAEASGGSFGRFSTWTTALSSVCLCGRRCKKGLREAWHTCGCKFVPDDHRADRNLFSAFLALFAGDGRLDAEAATAAWQAWGSDILLRRASREDETASGGPKGFPQPQAVRAVRRVEAQAGVRAGGGGNTTSGRAHRGSLPSLGGAP